VFENILVCLDGSSLAEQILPFASEQAARFHSQVTLLQVVPELVIAPPGIPGVPGAPVSTTRMFERLQKEQDKALAYLEEVALRLRNEGCQVECVVLPGRAGEAIVNYTEQNQVNLIAIATHGHGGFRRAVYGSTIDHVLRFSGLPLLVITPRTDRRLPPNR
jgi:nucleotide-binding universal stress UspA family protein